MQIKLIEKQHQINKSLSVLYFTTDLNIGSKTLRCDMPAIYLNQLGHNAKTTIWLRFISETYLVKSWQDFDVFVFHRPTKPEVLEAIKAIKLKGKKIIVDNDDDYLHLPYENPAWQGCKDKSDAIPTMLECYRLADVVTVSTSSLADTIRPYNPNVVILENCIDFELYKQPEEKKHKGLRIGWTGMDRPSDISIVANVVDQICDEYSEVSLFIGGDPATLKHFKTDKKYFMNYVLPCDYHKMLREIDIGIVPLVDNKFNDAKSDLKGLEFASQGIPFIASPSASYRQFADSCSANMLAKRSKDWKRMLVRLIEDKKYREELGNKQYEYTKSRDIKKNIDKWIQIYS